MIRQRKAGYFLAISFAKRGMCGAGQIAAKGLKHLFDFILKPTVTWLPIRSRWWAA